VKGTGVRTISAEIDTLDRGIRSGALRAKRGNVFKTSTENQTSERVVRARNAESGSRYKP